MHTLYLARNRCWWTLAHLDMRARLSPPSAALTSTRPPSIGSFLTHFDYDHSGSAQQLSAELGAPVAIHTGDAPLLEQPQTCLGLRRLLYHPPGPQILRWQPIRADIELSDGDNLGEWRVLHTPGHTPGNVSLIRDTIALLEIRWSSGTVSCDPMCGTSQPITLRNWHRPNSLLKPVSMLSYQATLRRA